MFLNTDKVRSIILKALIFVKVNPIRIEIGLLKIWSVINYKAQAACESKMPKWEVFPSTLNLGVKIGRRFGWKEKI